MQRKLPAYPLFVKDPNFSLWSAGDSLAETDVKSWWGERKPVYGFVKTEEGTFCFLGNFNDVKNCGVKRAEQTAVSVSSFTTDYEFKAGKAAVKVSFVSPLLLTDTELTSMPACYINYEVKGAKSAEVSLFVNRRICYNDIRENSDKEVRGGVVRGKGCEAAFLGLKRQAYLSNNDDAIGADWGYFYLACDFARVTDDMGMAAYLSAGIKEFSFDGAEKYMVATGGKSGRIIMAYDDIVAIDYFGDFRKTLYLENHTVLDAIEYVTEKGDEIDGRLAEFDSELKARAKTVSEDYYAILAASLRQSVAAHKTVRDKDGNLLFLSKENCSNGCIATVDVSYPSIPLFLLYNVELVKGMMRPILKFADMPVWTYDFAPHDAGTYPACCGQVYAGKRDGSAYHANYTKDGWCQTHFPLYSLPANFDAYDMKYQMPVEECANMLVMFAACYRYDGDISFFRENKEVCAKWVEYLVKYGLKPENQLCTDDFAGHLSNNLNLAIKATVGIGAYAQLLKADGDDGADEYGKIAKDFAAEITAFSAKFAHSPLTWDGDENSFSLKYNLAFDKILKLNLFPESLYESETDYYAEISNEFGVPLDSRKSYTKCDWICWAAALTDNAEKKAKIIAPLARFLVASPVRVPFTDWYDTQTGAQCGFQARSVVGGCFILLMK